MHNSLMGTLKIPFILSTKNGKQAIIAFGSRYLIRKYSMHGIRYDIRKGWNF